MCNACNKSPLAMRPDPLTPTERAKLERLKAIDPRNYPALLPAWVKAHQRAVALPKPFVFLANQPARFPAWTHRKFDPATANPGYFGIPDNPHLSVAGYIAKFNELNGLKRTAP